MRQRLLIFGAVFVVVVILLIINAASYVRINRAPESEIEPDRSSYNSGPTGTRAYYDYLQESGHRVMRWQEPPSGLNVLEGTERPDVFVVVGSLRKEFDDDEIADLLLWVHLGGRLVLIDRYPPEDLLNESGKWKVALRPAPYSVLTATPDNPTALTAGVKPATPAQPSLLLTNVEQIQPSRLASVIEFRREPDEPDETIKVDASEPEAEEEETPPDINTNSGPIVVSNEPAEEVEEQPSAPVVELVQERGPLMVDLAHGAGRIILVADPYLVANDGISLADNLILAQNLVSTKGGLIAFDEYHQGRAISQNQLAAYFAGTPVLPILAQLALLVVVVVWTRSRRFGNPLPLVQPDRRSKLEYVASMAELQQRSRAYDLAVENIYLRTRRALARYAGTDGNVPRGEIAKRVAARSKLDAHQLETVMRQCEDSINGDPTSAKQAISLVARLREIEETLGMRFRQREVKQAREL